MLDKEERLAIILILIELIIVDIVLLIAWSQPDISTCKYVHDNQTGGYYSEGCREECGCHIIAEYNVEVDVDDIGTAIRDIINTNITETEI